MRTIICEVLDIHYVFSDHLDEDSFSSRRSSAHRLVDFLSASGFIRT